VLLAPKATRIAVGAHGGEGATGAIFSTYELLDAEEQAARVKRVLDTLSKARRAAGTADAEAMRGVESVQAEVVSLLEQEAASPSDALDRFMHATARATQGGVRAWMMETDSLDKLSFPPELLQLPFLRAGIVVGAHRPEREPWVRYVVLIVVGDGAHI
jgi:hypothetical protein